MIKPRQMINPLKREKTPLQPVVKWNPPVKERQATITEAKIEPNLISTVDDPLMKRGRRG